jgi:hypothetical protein
MMALIRAEMPVCAGAAVSAGAVAAVAVGADVAMAGVADVADAPVCDVAVAAAELNDWNTLANGLVAGALVVGVK